MKERLKTKGKEKWTSPTVEEKQANGLENSLFSRAQCSRPLN